MKGVILSPPPNFVELELEGSEWPHLPPEVEEDREETPLTWTSTGGEINRQIDDILISQRFRNRIRLSHAIAGRAGNMQE